MKTRCLVLLLVAPHAHAEIGIQHQAAGCLVAGKLPRLSSTFTPADAVAQARIYFRAKGTPSWYWVPMAREGSAYQGILPKPLKSTPGIEYYVEAVDTSAGTSRTQEYAADVVQDSGACSKKVLVAVVASAAKVAVGLPAGVSGAALVPAGFAADGVVAAGAAGAVGATSAAGSGGTGAAAGGAAAGGGIGAGALIIGGVAVAGGAAAIVATKGGGSGANESTDPVQTTGYAVKLGAPIDLSVCGAPGSSPAFGGGAILSADPNGNFNDFWGQGGILRATGTLTSTSFTATLRCVNGAGPTGSMSASGTGGSYSGSFEFNGSQGPVTITRIQ